MLYRLKREPDPIDAEQYLKTGPVPVGLKVDGDGLAFVVTINETKHYVDWTDWIVREPCTTRHKVIRDAVFRSTYEVYKTDVQKSAEAGFNS